MNKIPESQTVHIIGAGFSGLTLAYRYAKLGCKIKVYDQRSEPGGMIQTKQLSLGFGETAAVSISETDRLVSLLDDLQMHYLRPLQKRRYFFRKDKYPFRGLTQWPLSIGETFKLFFKFLSQFLIRQLSPIPNESLASWGRRGIGKTASFYLLQTAMQGIYAGSAKTLSASLVLSNLAKHKSERNPKDRIKGLITFRDGMQSLMSTLASKAKENGVDFVWNQQVDLNELKKLFPNDPIVICTSAPQASFMLQSLSSAKDSESTYKDTSDLLNKIEYVPLISVTATWASDRKKHHQALGALICRDQEVRALGVLINDCLSPRGWNFCSETWIYGGATDPDILTLSDSDLLQTLLKDRREIFADKNVCELTNPIDFLVTRWNSALPHYNLELERILTELNPKLEQLATKQKIYLHGNYLGGIGLSKILARTEQLEIRF